VGVALAADGGEVDRRAPTSRRAVAGAGTGSVPCAVSTTPEPTAIGDACTTSMPSRSSPRQAPAMSTIASAAPTSWKCTFSTVAVDVPLGFGEPLEHPARVRQRPPAAPRARGSPRRDEVPLRLRSGDGDVDVTGAERPAPHGRLRHGHAR
jgi:hypothetical protein